MMNKTNVFLFRISDRGGGIEHSVVPKVMQYNFTTANSDAEQAEEEAAKSPYDVMSHMMESSNRSAARGPMHG